MPRFALLLSAALSSLAGCGSSSGIDLAALSGSCSINSDCDPGLVCVFSECHDPCASSRDCPTGARCVLGDKPVHVCQLASEEMCARTSDCPAAQVCGSDGKCRDGCVSDSECLATQTCVEATCADVKELVDGGLPGADGGAGAGGNGGAAGASGSAGSGGAVIPAACGNGQIDPGETCDASGDPRCDASCQAACLSGEAEDPVTHDCYVAVTTAADFQTVRAACVALGGDLAVPKDAAEQAMIGMLDPGGWIGVTVNDHVALSVRGQPLVASYWTDTLNNGCAVEAPDGWTPDQDCTQARMGLCALPPHGTPAPGTCGDGHIDPGEECDTPASLGCVGCVVVCEGVGATKLASTHHCYFVADAQGQGWSTVSSLCEQSAAYLVVIDDDAEETLVAGMTPNSWVSATDAATTGTFLTAAAAPVPKTYWAPMEPAAQDPDGKPAHCASINMDGSWHNADCAQNYAGVCERDPPM